MRSVSAIYFHWAREGAIERPKEDEQFDRLTGISSHYQYFMLREGGVLMRPTHAGARPASRWLPPDPAPASASPRITWLGTAATRPPNPVPATRVCFTRFTSGKTRAGQDQGAYKQPGQAGAGTGTSSRRWASQPGQWVLV
jgi:hypothetical protein